MRLREREPVPQAPVEAAGLSAERAGHGLSAAGVGLSAASGVGLSAASSGDTADAEPSPSRPGSRPGTPRVR